MNLKTTLLAVLSAVQPYLGIYGKIIIASLKAMIERLVPDDATIAQPVGAAPDSAKFFLQDLFGALRLNYIPESFWWAVDLVSGFVIGKLADVAWDAVFPPAAPLARSVAVGSANEELKNAVEAHFAG